MTKTTLHSRIISLFIVAIFTFLDKLEAYVKFVRANKKVSYTIVMLDGRTKFFSLTKKRHEHGNIKYLSKIIKFSR